MNLAPKCKAEILKFLQQNITETIYELGLDQYFLNMVSKAEEYKKIIICTSLMLKTSL